MKAATRSVLVNLPLPRLPILSAVKDSPFKDLSKDIRNQVKINVPGTSAFQCDIEGVDVDTIVGCYFVVKKNSEEI
ncbi:10026_t:CDS:2, partial [Acaulospora colombiana]